MTWEKDFAPWLGEDAGVWASNLEAPEPSWAVIVATKDAGAAETALGHFRADDPDATYTERSYDGVDYAVDAERVANGVIDDFVVVGTEDAFKRTADMRDGGDALADSDRYTDAVGDLDEDSLGHYYMDLRPVFDAALKQDPATAAQLEQFKSVLPFDQLGPITGAFEADADGMSLDTVLTGVPEGPFRDLAKLWTGVGGRAAGRPAGRRLGRAGHPRPRRGGGVDDQLVRGRDRRARRSPRRSSRRPGWTCRRTSSPGSATSAASSAARTRRRSTARS